MSSPLAIEATPVTLSVKGSRGGQQQGGQRTTAPTSPRNQAGMTSPRGSGPGLTSPRNAPDPRLSGAQVDALLRDCLRKNRRAIEEAFQSVDPLNEGTIHTSEFERVINHFFFPLSSVQHTQLVDRVGLYHDGSIDYDNFIAFLANKSVPKKMDPLKKADRALNRPLPEQVSEAEVEARVRHAVVSNREKMRRAFRMHDRTGGLGRIRRDDFCQVMNSFVMVMTKEQFDRFWAAFDVVGDGYMDYETFMETIASSSGHTVPSKSSKGLKPHVDHSSLAEVGQRLVADPKSVPLQHIENQVRNLMKKKRTELQEVLSEASERSDGFVQRAQLKRAMDDTLVPIDDSVFQGILLSVGLTKASRSIPYEDFMRRFLANEDRAVLAEAVTEKVPGSDGHVVGPDKGMDLNTIFAIIRRDIPVGSAALLTKFVQNDADRTGQVSAFELRSILGSYNVHLPESGYRCLMEYLDPRGKGMLRYHEFLEKFAPTVGEGKKKWLNDVNNYNRARPAEDMTFRQFKNNLQDKMRAKGKPLSELFLEIDTNKDGTISPQELREFLQENYLNSSDANFQRLWQLCDINRDGMIQFSEFLSAMGLELNPGDVQGVSQQIAGASTQQAAKHSEDQRKKMLAISEKSGEQAMVNYQQWQRAKRTLSQRVDSGHLKAAFEAFDGDHDGQLSAHQLAEMLQHLKIVEDDEIMACALSGAGEQFAYEQIPALFDANPFVAAEQSLQQGRPPVRASARPPAGTSNKKANETPPLFRREPRKPAAAATSTSQAQGPKVTLRAEEIAERLREMIQLKFADMHSAFRKFDSNLDGFINRKEFQKVLVNFHFKLDKAELEKLLTHIGMKADDAMLRYEDFLQFFGAREGSDAHRFLISTHRYNTALEPSKMTAEQACKELPYKIADAFKTVHEAYKAVDQDGSRLVKRPGLKKLLDRFNIPMTNVEFEKLWRMFDSNNDGSLQVDEFFGSVGMEVTSTDTGASLMITEESELEEQRHRDEQREKMANISEQHRQAAQRMPAADIGDQVKWKMEQERRTLHQIAKGADTNEDAVLSREELLTILDQRGFDIDSEKLERVLELIGLASLDMIPYRDFMNAFSDTQTLGGGRARPGDLAAEDDEVRRFMGDASTSRSRGPSMQSILKRPAAPTPTSKPHQQTSIVHDGMPLHEFLPIVRQQVIGQQQRLREQLLRADKEQCGLIEIRLLKSALTAHCGVKLTTRQLQSLVEKTLSSHRGKVSYNHFLDYFDVPVCVETANKLTSYDPNASGGRHSRPASDDKLRLPAVASLAGKERSPRPNKLAGGAAAAAAAGRERSLQDSERLKLPMIQESPGRGLQSGGGDKLREILDNIRSKTHSKIKEMQRAFRRIDPRRTGAVPTNEFRTLLKSFGVELSSNQFFRLQDAFDTGKGSLQNAKIDYEQFMSTCY
ncbi:EF-hand calcium-binding domain-containing protein 6-like [Sycon ciliatum]|uniref:EF-hand calcium-binding domain-containing protein 6-like n=1 Tax=Sycon ciliatum TaxID=27933 RepID=UPI0031F717B7